MDWAILAVLCNGSGCLSLSLKWAGLSKLFFLMGQCLSKLFFVMGRAVLAVLCNGLGCLSCSLQWAGLS